MISFIYARSWESIIYWRLNATWSFNKNDLNKRLRTKFHTFISIRIWWHKHKHTTTHTHEWQQGHWVDEHVAIDERPQECMINIWSLAQQICKPSINFRFHEDTLAFWPRVSVCVSVFPSWCAAIVQKHLCFCTTCAVRSASWCHAIHWLQIQPRSFNVCESLRFFYSLHLNGNTSEGSYALCVLPLAEWSSCEKVHFVQLQIFKARSTMPSGHDGSHKLDRWAFVGCFCELFP